MVTNLIKKEEINYSIEAKICLATTAREVGEKLIRIGKIDLGSRYLKEAIDHGAEVLKLRKQLGESDYVDASIGNISDNVQRHPARSLPPQEIDGSGGRDSCGS